VPTLLSIPTIFGISGEVYLILLLISIPTYFLWRWLFTKTIPDEKKRKTYTWVATFIASPLIYIAIIAIWIYAMSFYPKYSFDAGKWKDDRDERYELSGNLIESKILIGKTKSEIRQMLGDEENPETEDTWNYYLGMRPELFNLDPDYLEIDFKDNKVINVVQHER
jgi:hypothetical protein